MNNYSVPDQTKRVVEQATKLVRTIEPVIVSE